MQPRKGQENIDEGRGVSLKGMVGGNKNHMNLVHLIRYGGHL